MPGCHGVAERGHNQTAKPATSATLAWPPGCTIEHAMTRDQFQEWSRVFEGVTVRELRHLREEPRAYIQLPIVHAIAPEVTRAIRRAS